MIYKNDSTKQKMFINKYNTKMFLMYGFAILFNFILFYVVLPKYRPDQNFGHYRSSGENFMQ